MWTRSWNGSGNSFTTSWMPFIGISAYKKVGKTAMTSSGEFEFSVRVKANGNKERANEAIYVLRESVHAHASIVIHEYNGLDFVVTPVKLRRRQRKQKANQNGLANSSS